MWTDCRRTKIHCQPMALNRKELFTVFAEHISWAVGGLLRFRRELKHDGAKKDTAPIGGDMSSRAVTKRDSPSVPFGWRKAQMRQQSWPKRGGRRCTSWLLDGGVSLSCWGRSSQTGRYRWYQYHRLGANKVQNQGFSDALSKSDLTPERVFQTMLLGNPRNEGSSH